MHRIIHFIFILSWTSLLVSSCGSKTNILGLTTPSQHKKSFDYLVSQARVHYDRNQLEEALELAQAAYDMNPSSEEGAVLLGYIYLSLAKVSPFGLAQGLIDTGGSEEESAASLAEGDGGEEEGDTTDVMDQLKEVIGLSEDAFRKLGTYDTTEPDYPVIVPHCAEEARTLIDVLTYANNAINVVCAFVSERVLHQDDLRHKCARRSQDELRLQGKAHFLWALAHLTEALAFHSVFTYSTHPETDRTNLELRVNSVNAIDANDLSQLPTFVTRLQSLEETVSKVLPTGDCSVSAPTTQFNAMLYDMTTVNKGFAEIQGIPPKITESISKSMEKINNAKANADSTTSQDAGDTAQKSAFKGQMTKNVTSTLNDKLDELAAKPEGEISSEDTTKICDSVDSISGGNKPTEETHPFCGGTLGVEEGGEAGGDTGGGIDPAQLPDTLPDTLPETL